MESTNQVSTSRENEETCQVGSVILSNERLVSLLVNGEERVCLAQLSNTLLKDYSYNEIHNRRVALGITCVQCTPFQLDILRKAGAMPVSSRRCGMITRREAERLFKSFFNEIAPPSLPADFVFNVYHKCGWGCSGFFMPNRYNSSRAKCIKCAHCGMMFSPNKFIFHCHQTGGTEYTHPDAANFNSWRRHIQLTAHHGRTKEIEYAWEDVKALFNGGSRKRLATTPTDSEDGDLPAKFVNGVFSSHVGRQTSSALTQSSSAQLRLPIAPPVPRFPPGFPPPFLRPNVSEAPLWSMSHHLAFNELLHRSRLLVPRANSMPSFPATVSHSLPYGSCLPLDDSQRKTSGNISSDAASSKLGGSEKKIRRPWADADKQVDGGGSPQKNPESNWSHETSPNERSQALLLREFLHRSSLL